MTETVAGPAQPSSDPRGEECPHRGGDGLIILSACCFATLPIFGRWAYLSGVRMLQLLSWRFLIAVALLWALLALTRRLAPLPARTRAALLGMGMIFVVMSSIYFLALRFTPISTLTLLFYTYPAFVTVLAALVLKEPLSRIKVSALLLALAGCALVLRPTEIGDWRGAALALVAAVIYSSYVLIGTRLARGLDPYVMTTWIMSFAAVVFVGLSLWRREMVAPRGFAAWVAIAGLVVVATLLAEVAFFAGLPLAGASRAAILSTVEPLFALLLSAAFLGETIPPVRFLGGGLILGSVILIHRESG